MEGISCLFNGSFAAFLRWLCDSHPPTYQATSASTGFNAVPSHWSTAATKLPLIAGISAVQEGLEVEFACDSRATVQYLHTLYPEVVFHRDTSNIRHVLGKYVDSPGISILFP